MLPYSFQITNRVQLTKDLDKLKAHLIKRAIAIDALDMLPAGWRDAETLLLAAVERRLKEDQCQTQTQSE